MTSWVALVLAGISVSGGSVTTGVSLRGRGETQSASAVAHGRLGVRADVSWFFVEARGSVLLSGETTVTAQDLGSSLTIGVKPSDVVRRVSLEFIPFNSVNRRAFFDWDNRVGRFAPTRAVPALTLELELQRVTAWLTDRLSLPVDSGVIGIAAPRPADPDLLAGIEVTLIDGLELGFRGGWIPSALVRGINSQFIASARLQYTRAHAVAPIPDFVNYGTDPQRFERFFSPLQDGNALQASLEGGFAASRSAGSLTSAGWVDAQLRVQLDALRLSFTGRLQTTEFLYFDESPRIAAAGTRSPRLLGLVGAGWTLRSARLTPALLFGISRPASFEPPSFDGSGANPPPGVGPRVFTKDRETAYLYPLEFVRAPRVQFGASLTWQPIDGVTLISAFDVNTLQEIRFVDDAGFVATPRLIDAPVVRGQVLAQFSW